MVGQCRVDLGFGVQAQQPSLCQIVVHHDAVGQRYALAFNGRLQHSRQVVDAHATPGYPHRLCPPFPATAPKWESPPVHPLTGHESRWWQQHGRADRRYRFAHQLFHLHVRPALAVTVSTSAPCWCSRSSPYESRPKPARISGKARSAFSSNTNHILPLAARTKSGASQPIFQRTHQLADRCRGDAQLNRPVYRGGFNS